MTLLEVKNLKKIYTTRFGASRVQALSRLGCCRFAICDK